MKHQLSLWIGFVLWIAMSIVATCWANGWTAMSEPATARFTLLLVSLVLNGLLVFGMLMPDPREGDE